MIQWIDWAIKPHHKQTIVVGSMVYPLVFVDPSALCFRITSHTVFTSHIVLRLQYSKFSYSFHWIMLILGEQLDHELSEVVQGLLFQGYSSPNFDSYSLYNLHLIKLLFLSCCIERMWRIAARLQYSKFLYSFKVTLHQIFIELLLIKASSLAFRLTPPTVFTSTSWDFEVIQHLFLRLQYTNF